MKIEPPRRVPDNEQKLIVLYCLDRFGPCTQWQLLQFLANRDLMNYFDMMFALTDLCAGGQAVRNGKPTGSVYEITAAGREALRLFGGRVPKSAAALVDESADALRAAFRQEAHAQQSIRQTDRGDWEVALSTAEQDAELMSLRLNVPTRDLAQRLSARWPQKAAEIYETVFRLLSEEENP